MTTGKVITTALHRVQRGHGRGYVEHARRGPVQRPARVAVMLALAHKIREAVASGKADSQADVARQIGLTPARITQRLDLLRLAPDIQERLLFLEAIDGVEPMTERQLRPLTREPHWADQRAAFDGPSLGGAGRSGAESQVGSE